MIFSFNQAAGIFLMCLGGLIVLVGVYNLVSAIVDWKRVVGSNKPIEDDSLVRVRVDDGITFFVRSTVEEFGKNFEHSIKAIEVLVIKDEKGNDHYLNPFHILYYEKASQ
jgi:hypothetical protein